MHRRPSALLQVGVAALAQLGAVLEVVVQGLVVLTVQGEGRLPEWCWAEGCLLELVPLPEGWMMRRVLSGEILFLPERAPEIRPSSLAAVRQVVVWWVWLRG